MKNRNIVITVCALVAVTSFGCSKHKSGNAPAPANKVQPAGQPAVEKVEIKNETTSEIQKLSETNYAVLPPSMVVKSISLSKTPIQLACKQINKINKELSALKAELKSTIALAQEDQSAETQVDVVAAVVDAKTAELENLKLGKKFATDVVYSKDQYLANVETLKKANPSIVFEMQQPEKIKLAVKSADGKTTYAEQLLDTSVMMTEGAFDQTASDIKMRLEVNYDVICTQKSLNPFSAKPEQKAKIEMSFQN